MVFPLYFWLLFAAALLISAIGFKNYVWFISLGYGFSIAGEGILMLILFGINQKLTLGTVICCALLIAYGLRLGGYLAFRENQRRNPESGQTRRNEPGTSLSTEALCGFAPGDIQRDLSEPGIRCELCAEFSVYPAYRVDIYPQLETGNKIKKA